VIVGDGPLRDRVPEAVGFVPHDRIGEYYERAAVVCVPSRREGYGMVAREAMAYGRPVVATRVGGLVESAAAALVDVGDVPALRRAVEALLADEDSRHRLGRAGRERIEQGREDGSVVTRLAVYQRALGAETPCGGDIYR
jgi:glycosyltransferase involved in cell wall biosynthesis